MAVDGSGDNERPSCFNGPYLAGGDKSHIEAFNAENEGPMSSAGPELPDSGERHFSGVRGLPDSGDRQYSGSLVRGPQPLLALPSTSSSTFEDYLNTNIDNNDENGHKYVGLVNQAMTCYLNSLIQTLYMTPEFRNAIYSWRFSGNVDEESKNIPFQLQKLFLLLQTSEKASLETKDLTASFGWESSDAYDQHDVQELCRIMFDALEHKWRKTENRSIIQDLYRGNIEDYVKCIKCNNERVKHDVFLDLPLAVKQFGTNHQYQSIEEALREFVKPEILEGNNQYECENCRSKQNAEKGLRITAFPYLLTMQLKRFDFDYQTLHRLKLNNRVTFPNYLNINGFIYTPQPKMSYADMAKKPKAELDCRNQMEDENISESLWIDASIDSDELKQMLDGGKHVYELFSVMVHQGSASAGHYYAYIKNMDQNKWFCFNDSSVQPASTEEIRRTYGGSPGWSFSNANAYMLMYRQIDPSRNKSFLRTDALPNHLVELKDKILAEEEKRVQKQKYDQELVTIYFKINETPYIDHELKVILHKDVSLVTLFNEIMEKFLAAQKESNGVVINIVEWQNRSRLFFCDSSWEICGCLMINDLTENDKTLEMLVKEYSAPYFYRQDLYILLDTKYDLALDFYDFPKIITHTRTFKVHIVNVVTGEINFVKNVCIDLNLTVADAKRECLSFIPEINRTDWRNCRLIIDRPTYTSFDNEPILGLVLPERDNDFMNEIQLPRHDPIPIFLDIGDAEILAADRLVKPDENSKFYKIIERKKFSRHLCVILPTENEFVRAGFQQFPSLDSNFVSPPFLPQHQSSADELSEASERKKKRSSNTFTFQAQDSQHSTAQQLAQQEEKRIQLALHILGDVNPNDEIDIDLLNKISSSNKMEEDVLEWKKKMEEANPSIQSHDTAERSSDLTPQKVANFSEKLYDSVSRLPKYENVSHTASTSGSGFFGLSPDQDPPPPYSSVPSDQNSPISTNLGSPMEISPLPCTPKISPVVSDTSGDENAREEYREPISLSTSRQLSNEPQEVIKLVRKLNNIKNIQNNYQVEGPAQENADCESTSDTHTIVESTSDSTVTVTPASILQPLEYPINILKIDHGDDLEHPNIHIELDSRQKFSYLRFWLSEFLQLDSATFQMVKWFDDTAYGLPLQGFDNSTIGDSFINANNVNKVAIKFNCPPSGSNDNVNDTSLFKANNEGDLKARRRERPLRIKMFSVSEGDTSQQPVDS